MINTKMVKTGWVTKLKLLYNVNVNDIIHYHINDIYEYDGIKNNANYHTFIYDFLNLNKMDIIKIPLSHAIDGQYVYINGLGFCESLSIYRNNHHYIIVDRQAKTYFKMNAESIFLFSGLLKRCKKQILHDYVI